MKALVLYYSFEGHTKEIAEVIAQAINADLEAIKPLHELRSHGFSKYIWGGRQAVMGKKPELQELTSNVQGYDVLFIGTPVWAFTYSPPIRTLIHSNLLKDMKVVFFCTHDGGPGKTIEKFKKAVENQCEFIDGTDFFHGGENILRHKENAVSWAIKCVKDML